MDSPQNKSTTRHSHNAFAAEIRADTLSFVIGGGICLYFGFTWLADIPTNADEEAKKIWFAIDTAFIWSLRVIGALFLLTAALALTGRPFALIPALLAEGAFTLLMLAMAIDTTLEARADNIGFDAYAILFLIMTVIGASGVRRLWRLHRDATRHQNAPPAP